MKEKRQANDSKFGEYGINVNFVEIKNQYISIRTYERGVEDETLSCGSGAVATAISSHYKGLVKNYSEILIQTLGGALKVDFKCEKEKYFKTYLSGKTQKVFSGIISI